MEISCGELVVEGLGGEFGGAGASAQVPAVTDHRISSPWPVLGGAPWVFLQPCTCQPPPKPAVCCCQTQTCCRTSCGCS